MLRPPAIHGEGYGRGSGSCRHAAGDGRAGGCAPCGADGTAPPPVRWEVVRRAVYPRQGDRLTPEPPPYPPPDPVAATLAPFIDAGEAAVLARLPLLSNQERAVWALTGRGMRAKAVAWELAISPKTAETHLARIRAKLGGEGGPLPADDLAFLARLWVRAGGAPHIAE